MKLEMLAQEARDCPACRLASSRTQVVFHDGVPGAALLIVGEGPGADEDRTGRPFVGRAGVLLDRILAAVELGRQDVYITNIVKCRPPGNHTPEQDEIAACQRWLRPQLELLRPKVILTLGNTPTRHLLDTRQGITSLRGRWHRYRHPPERTSGSSWEAWLMPMFHPAYLLRNDSRAPGGPKSLTWRDIREVKAVLDGRLDPARERRAQGAP
ncbi:uracil-DNA glycosylase [Deinococcus peraridilitoris]|uniref:Type-4 uracil-DNA glycosylase n=1 Tax=Deinococcus peraridilitoris (strain DSM 19664 / LMG 22246 / CIP 109416 / KR-200) TaxID=937777 RepID=K9ZWH2_DEIPD|nr:uracil-DNA glycosylase [Deinococcus peraridilitoris]AFZ65998.1 uracil-DNA glycosylase, family 4 [Deinococcus peraridilitoris DSM 19664]